MKGGGRRSAFSVDGCVGGGCGASLDGGLWTTGRSPRDWVWVVNGRRWLMGGGDWSFIGAERCGSWRMVGDGLWMMGSGWSVVRGRLGGG